MRAAVLDEPGTPLAVEELSLAEPGAGEVRVRVDTAGVCHTDLHYMAGDLTCATPIVPGHEGAGVIEEVGPGVTRLAPGDPVILMWRPRCGRCAFCSTGRPALCETAKIQIATNGLLDGTSRLRRGQQEVKHLLGVSCFAERCVVAEQSVVAIPEGIPPEIASLIGCAVITGAGAVLNVVERAPGSSILVVGAGGVGLSCVMAARLAGARTIIAADVVPQRLERAVRLGATHTVDSTAVDLVDGVHEFCPDGVDWALEAVGRAETLEPALASVRKGGTLVAIGLGPVDSSFRVPINPLVQQEKRIVGSLYGSANTVTDVPRLIELYRAGLLPLEELLGPRFPLSRANEACRALVNGTVGRAVIVPSLADDA